jgi:hypothetical protein
VPNNEVLDFLSRVPDDEEILDVRELRSDSHGQQGGQNTGGGDSSKGSEKQKKKR